MSNVPPIIARVLAMPKTHRVLVTYADGRTRHLDCHSEAAANNHAIGERRKVGRDLIDRDTGATVRVVSVDVLPIKEALAAEYVRLIGYDPFQDDPSTTVEEVQQILAEFKAELARSEQDA